ncbi:MAG: SufS family cysteine desulfurase [Nanoarchaeota archaeon]|nr:SufS family cysteine desulfurase [Nanoarchaeota archaeon]
MFNREELELIDYFKEKRKNFPILKQKVHGKKLVYVDNGATTQKPKVMLEAINDFYLNYNSNIHRSAHNLAEKADINFEATRQKVANLINANSNEIVFTSGTTDSLNKIVFGLEVQIKKGDEIILSVMEHHANLVPWQELAKKTGAVLKFVHLTSSFSLDMDELERLVSSKTKVVAIAHVSNVLGTVNPIKKISKLVKKVGAFFVVDAAQSLPHMKIDVKKIDCDFLSFSAHKMCGPTGVGVIYGKYSSLEKLNPIVFGGDMIDEVAFEKSSYNEIPYRFEAGTPNIEGVIAFGRVIDYLQDIGLNRIHKYEELLLKYFLEKVKEVENFELLGPWSMKDRAAVFSFNIKGIHSHDISAILDKEGIAIRGGHHCAMPLHDKYDFSSSSRISFYFYNTIEEIDYIISVLKKVEEKFEKGDFLL